jgi:hypothetical protein
VRKLRRRTFDPYQGWSKLIRMKVDASRRVKMAAITVTFLGVVAPTFTFADEAADRKAQAQRLFAEGQAALDKEDIASGCALMRTSLELFAVANSLFIVAQCDDRDGKLNLALEHWKLGLSVLDAKDKRAPVVNKSIEDLGVRIPRVRIMVSSKDEPLDVLLDDEVVPKNKLETPIFIDPGKHVITFRKEGHEDRRVEVLLDERERTEVIAELGKAIVTIPVPTTSGSTKPPPPPGMPPMKLGGFVALGIGGAALLGATITGGIVLANHSTIAEQCTNKVCANGVPNDLIQSQKSLVPLNAVFWGVGIAGAAAGTVMLVLSSRKTEEKKAVTVAPLFLNNGGGIGLSGRF